MSLVVRQVSHKRSSDVPTTTERHDQKSRTREAILAGARALLARGAPVTVTAAAAEQAISKATAYRYFSDARSLELEAGLAVEVLPFEEIIAGANTVRQRVLAVSLYILDLSLAHEAEFRQFLARNLDVWVAEGGAPRQRRGARRVQMFEAALAPARDAVGEDGLRRLVLGLTAATGTEAMIALLDIGEARQDEARDAVMSIADALLDTTLGPAVADATLPAGGPNTS